MNIISYILIGLLQIYILWNWLRITDTTSGYIYEGMKLKKIRVINYVNYCIWIIGFFIIPVLASMLDSKDVLYLLLVNTIFAKFFWDSLAPRLSSPKNIKGLVWKIIWGPIVDLVSGVLLIWLLALFFDFVLCFIIPDSIENSINFALNFLADLWMIQPTQILNYRFSIGLVFVVSFILRMRIFPLHIVRWKKIIVYYGALALILRVVKYLGRDFESIFAINSDYWSDKYSTLSIITIIVSWFLTFIINALLSIQKDITQEE